MVLGAHHELETVPKATYDTGQERPVTALEVLDPGANGRLGGSQHGEVQEDDVEEEGDKEEGGGKVEKGCTHICDQSCGDSTSSGTDPGFSCRGRERPNIYHALQHGAVILIQHA